MLAVYQFLTNALLQAPSSPVPLVDPSSIQSYVNRAREQVALLGECVRDKGTTDASATPTTIDFSAFVPESGGPYGKLISLRKMWVSPSGPLVDIRPAEWYENYTLISPPASGVVAAVYRRGASGTIDISFGVSLPVTLIIDGIWNPIPLLDDTTTEVIPVPWQEAVPFYAAWMAFMSLQRQRDADMMIQRFVERMNWLGAEVTPSQLPDNQLGGVGTKIAATHGSLATAAVPQRGGG